MSQIIIYANANGSMSMCIPTGEIPVEEVLAKDCPANAFIVEDAVIPKQYIQLFDAWEIKGQTVEVNKTKACDITKARLRMEREPLLKAQDVLFQRALENGSDTSAIVAEKQRLRDITSLCTEDKTLDELLALKP